MSIFFFFLNIGCQEIYLKRWRNQEKWKELERGACQNKSPRTKGVHLEKCSLVTFKPESLSPHRTAIMLALIVFQSYSRARTLRTSLNLTTTLKAARQYYHLVIKETVLWKRESLVQTHKARRRTIPASESPDLGVFLTKPNCFPLVHRPSSLQVSLQLPYTNNAILTFVCCPYLIEGLETVLFPFVGKLSHLDLVFVRLRLFFIIINYNNNQHQYYLIEALLGMNLFTL